MKRDAQNGIKRASVNVDLTVVFVIINVELMINAGCEYEELMDNGVCDK